MKRQTNISKRILIFLGITIGLSNFVMAGMPWDDGLATVKGAMTGGVATTISLLGIIGAGAGLIFGGSEMGQFMKSMLSVVLVVAIIIGANSVIEVASGSAGSMTGATIAQTRSFLNQC